MKQSHPNECLSCGEAFQSETAYDLDCPTCAKAKTQRNLEESKRENQERVRNNTPRLFQNTDILHPKFNVAAWSAIKGHRLSETQPWIGFVGMTGRCKSRLAYLYAAEEVLRRVTVHGGCYERLPSFRFVTSYEIGEMTLRQYGGDRQEQKDARGDLDALREAEVLLIDDIGKGRLTPAVASELFALIDHRHTHIFPTIWTSNSAPEVIAAGLPEDMAGPFAGRLIESSRILTFK